MRTLIAGLTWMLVLAFAVAATAADYKRIVAAPSYEHDRWGTWPTDHVKEFRAYIVSFDTNDDDDRDGEFELPESGKRFTHTTFNGLLLDRDSLTRAQPDRVARLNGRGLARQIVLSYCNGERTVAEVQALVQRDHPQLFPSAQALSSFVTTVLSWETSG